jgi:SAM-dependent methyltransferase
MTVISFGNTTQNVWEDFISLNNSRDKQFQVLGRAADYLDTDSRKDWWNKLDYARSLDQDSWPLPDVDDREGYYGPDHFSYWASGLQDAKMLLEAANSMGIQKPHQYLDIGCASGRVTRHTALLVPAMKTLGCDINRWHVEWCNRYLTSSICTFQNFSVPILPIESNTVDIVSAFSVFTHIEALETAWLMEIKRILRPGGIAWVTVHTEGTLADMTPDWPLWRPVMDFPDAGKLFDTEARTFPGDRLVLRWLSDRSYSSNIFYKEDYLRTTWSRIMSIKEIRRRCPSFQDVVLFQKG